MRTKICLRVNIEDENSKRRMMKHIAGIEGVDSVTVDMEERKITVMGETDPVYLVAKLRELGFRAELLSVDPAIKAKKDEKVGSAKQEKFEAEKKVGSKCDTENRGRNHYLGVQRAEAVGGFAGMNRAIEDKEGSEKRIVEAVAGFGGMNRAIEDKEGSEKRIVEVVAGFGDFTSIEVDIKKGMVTVVGKSVPVSVALKVREMGYRAKLLSLGPATEEENTDEEHNDDLYPSVVLPRVFHTSVFHADEDSTSSCTIA